MSGQNFRVVVVTNQTSPYQVELFNAVERLARGQIGIVYLHSTRPGRFWGPQVIEHRHVILDGNRRQWEQAAALLEKSELVVFSYYQHPFAYASLRQRAQSGNCWCFWGERPGATRLAWAGGWYRRWKLRDLHATKAAIWGIGEFALEGYRKEFGANRSYINLPYFSDLKRFAEARRDSRPTDEIRFLFSGSLIKRKGVELLAKVFVKLTKNFPQIRLDILGEGPLRGWLERTLVPCRNQVRFHGFKDWNDLPGFYAQADVLCVPSWHDGWALVVPEGLAAGLPVIGTDRTGAARELIKPGENGWMTKAGDARALLWAMREAITVGRAKLAAMSAAARQSVARHQLSDGAERFIRACEATLSDWRKSGA